MMGAGAERAPALLVLAGAAGREELIASLALGRAYCDESGARLELYGGAGVLEWARNVVLDGRHELEARDAAASLWLALGRSLAPGQSPVLLRAGRGVANTAQLHGLRDKARDCDGAFLFDAYGTCVALALNRAMPELFASLDWDGAVMSELRKRARRYGWRLAETALGKQGDVAGAQ